MALERWVELQHILREGPNVSMSHIAENLRLENEDSRASQPQKDVEGLESNSLVLDRIERDTESLESIANARLQGSVDDYTEEALPKDPSTSTQRLVTEQLFKIVQLMFDILPAIRGLRRDRLLELEREVLRGTQATSENVETDRMKIVTKVHPTFEQRLDHSLDLASGLETILRNDETWSKQNGQKIKIYSPIFSKERERLEEFKAAKRGDRKPAEVEKLLGTISGLEKALNQTLQDIEIKGKLGTKPGEKQHTDIKFSGKDTDAKIAEVVEVFRNSNTALWGQ